MTITRQDVALPLLGEQLAAAMKAGPMFQASDAFAVFTAALQGAIAGQGHYADDPEKAVRVAAQTTILAAAVWRSVAQNA